MKHLVCVLLLAITAITQQVTGECDTKGVVVEKSFLQSVHDCAEYLQVPKERLMQYLANDYPPDDETKCLVFCVGVDLGWWNNTCGLQVPSIVSYFQPVQGDKQYEKRTHECLERRVGAVRSPNSCCQAYETFQCYFQEFGNLVTCPQYVRLTKLQATQAAWDCLMMLRYPESLLKVYASGQVNDSPETRCLYHCVDLRTGLYTPEHGVSLSRFFVRDSSYNDLRYLSKETKACRDRVRHSGLDKCSEVYNTHQECLTGLGEDGYTSGLITAAAKLALAHLEVDCVHHVNHHLPTHVYPMPPKHTCSVCGNAYEGHRPYHTPAVGVEPAVALTYNKHPYTCDACKSSPMYNRPNDHCYRGPDCTCSRCRHY